MIRPARQGRQRVCNDPGFAGRQPQPYLEIASLKLNRQLIYYFEVGTKPTEIPDCDFYRVRIGQGLDGARAAQGADARFF